MHLESLCLCFNPLWYVGETNASQTCRGAIRVRGIILRSLQLPTVLGQLTRGVSKSRLDGCLRGVTSFILASHSCRFFKLRKSMN